MARRAPIRGRKQHVLQFIGSGRRHVQEYVVSAADRVSTHHLWHLRHGESKALRAVFIVIVEHYQHERLQTGTHPLGIADCRPGRRCSLPLRKRSPTRAGAPPAERALTAGTDLRFYTAAGIPAVHYGPGDLRLAHGVSEQVPVEDVLLSARSLALLALRICGVA